MAQSGNSEVAHPDSDNSPEIDVFESNTFLSPTSRTPLRPLNNPGSTSPALSPVRPNRVLQLATPPPPDYEQSQMLRGGATTATSSSSSLLTMASPNSREGVPVVRRTSRPRHDSESENRIITSHQNHRKTVYTAGRPPWYDSMGSNGVGNLTPLVIGVCGGSASGKTTVAKRIVELLDVKWVSLVSMDSFYKVLDEEHHNRAMQSEYNFDHPDAFDIELLVETLKRLKAWKSVDVPIYSFTTHSREDDKRTIYGANVVIVEGIMAFCDQSLIDVMDLKIFVDTDADIRLARRMTRDILERGRDLDGVLKQYNKFVKPAYENYIEPSRSTADIVVPRGGENSAAIKLIAQHVHNQLQARGNTVRSKLAKNTCGQDEILQSPGTLYVLENTPQVQGMHTIIRDQDTSRDDFVFYSQRLMRLLVEYAVSLLPYRQCSVTSHQGFRFEGQRIAIDSICGVSILRAGETLEPALRAVLKDIRIGKILIQTNMQTGEPELHYHRLPNGISNQHVLLLDATVSTGSAAIMAIRVLLDHDVKQENIILISLLMAQLGAYNVAYCFPRVKMVTSAVDPNLDSNFHIIPGLGNFGDRFFGTD